jgi:hypothetical protein
MADILKSLLQAYYDDITTEKQAGGSLDFIMSHYIIQSPENLPQDISTELPCVLIYPLQIPSEPMCVPAIHDQKVYEIVLSIIKEGYGDETLGIMGDSYEEGVIDMAVKVETRYRRQTFGLSGYVYQSLIDYTMLRIPPFLESHINQAHITFHHEYEDLRAAT